jgi:uncharacterized membrane protein
MRSEGQTLFATAIVVLLAFVLLDAAWLSLFAVDLFQKRLGPILRPEPSIAPIAAFYLIYAAGLVVLAVRPALAANSWRTAAALGAVVGLTAYATFDLTSLAVIDRWTVDLAVVDIVWGVVASALAAILGFAAGSRLTLRRTASE